jgi:3-hydroxymyristoyl/3-hydroxydecanoyl-(acyl carrier protein) dehydratase
VNASSEAVDVSLHIDPALPAFDGHFPGAPVLPGAYLLACVVHELEQRPALAAHLRAGTLEVQQAKFLAPVRPGDTLRLRLQADGDGIAFALQRDAVVIARGRLAAAAGAA